MLEEKLEAVMKTISIFLALINSLAAGLLITFCISDDGLLRAEFWWSAIKIILSIMVIASGIVTWLACIKDSKTGSVLLGSIILVVMGAVTVVWTYHLAVVSGDMEYYMIAFGLSLTVQGMASLLGFGMGSETIAIS